MRRFIIPMPADQTSATFVEWASSYCDADNSIYRNSDGNIVVDTMGNCTAHDAVEVEYVL